MKCSMSPETWAGDRGLFVFRCVDPAKGDRWTFFVEQSTLAELGSDGSFDPAATFDKLRSQIYAAAYARMADADPTSQQAITADDIRGAS